MFFEDLKYDVQERIIENVTEKFKDTDEYRKMVRWHQGGIKRWLNEKVEDYINRHNNPYDIIEMLNKNI